MKKLLFLLTVITSIFSANAQKVYTESDIRIIPKPTQTLIKTGVFEFTKDTKFVVNGDFQKDARKCFGF
ncbi:hypothetical protein [Flavobacterium ginsengisoli]|uniref:hypothetical protein n=1 Tax=Flavobacterium ginsengisoli TaxID=871694 RepID=UPI002414FD99|nr:hypothetical protein [Flavobacterium ginsengisoli]